MTTSLQPAVTVGGQLDDARTQLREVTPILGYDDGLYAMLATPRRAVTGAIPPRRDNGDTELVVGHRVQQPSRVAQPTAACATPLTWTSTRCVPWGCG